jgi:hypothetical protein
MRSGTAEGNCKVTWHSQEIGVKKSAQGKASICTMPIRALLASNTRQFDVAVIQSL